MKSYKVEDRVVVKETFRRAVGNELYGEVVLSVAPAAAFAFRSHAVWPGQNYDQAVLTGIVEVLGDAGVGRGLAAEFILQEIGSHRDVSHWDAYYEAAKQATVRILRQIEVAA